MHTSKYYIRHKYSCGSAVTVCEGLERCGPRAGRCCGVQQCVGGWDSRTRGVNVVTPSPLPHSFEHRPTPAFGQVNSQKVIGRQIITPSSWRVAFGGHMGNGFKARRGPNQDTGMWPHMCTDTRPYTPKFKTQTANEGRTTWCGRGEGWYQSSPYLTHHFTVRL